MNHLPDLVHRLEGYLLSHFRPLQGARLLVAYSGGADSTALMHLLAELRSRRQFQLRALWVDHVLRPVEERQAEALRVEENCRHWGVELITGRLTPEMHQQFQHLGPEGMAREGRLIILTREAEIWKAQGILTAHNLDDQAETLLMRLLKGNSFLGLGGIPRQRGLFHRPLLDTPKSDLREYLRQKGQVWWEDSTNAQGNYERNKFRLTAVPVLDSLYPGWRQSLGRWGEHQASEVRTLRSQVAAYPVDGGRGGVIPREVWNTWSLRARIHWLGGFLRTEKGQRIPWGRLEQELRRLEAGKVISVPGLRQAVLLPGDAGVKYGALPGSVGDITVAKSLDIGYFKTITLETTQNFLGKTLVLGMSVQGKALPAPLPGEKVFLISRSWGDSFEFPQGTRGLKKLFQAWGVPESERSGIPLVVSGKRVLAVLGSFYGFEDWYRPLKEDERPVYLYVR